MPRTALFLASFALISVDAKAHAPPYATGIAFLTTPAGERSMIRTNRGLIVGSREEGFRLVCNDAFQANLSETAPLAQLAGGGLLVGTYAGGLLRSDSAFCDFEATGPSEVSPVDVERGAAGVLRALLLPLDGSDGALFESSDGGGSFDRLSAVGTAPTALVTAPENPDRVYISSNTTEGNLSIGHVLASDDGGRHFTDHVIELDASELRAFVLAVDANDPKRLFVRTQSRDGIALERLLLSEDAGETFRTVLSAPGPLTLALGNAGAAWAGAADGVYRSQDRGETFEPIPNTGLTRLGCLSVHAGKLYACALRELEFGVLASDDAGSTFHWFVRFPDVTARAACPPSSDEGSSCALPFEDWSREQLLSTAGAAGAAGGATGSAAGAPPTAAGAAGIPGGPPGVAPPENSANDSAGGCSIRATAKRGALELTLAAIVGLWASHRRKHHA